jgi:predicted NAD-dependent protein-ADP-ribosyltransferase YbiA (DUF1768 family)
MVVSNIIQNVTFKEDKSVEKHDKKTEVSIFRITLLDIDVNVSVGKVNTSLYDDIYFAPVYLVLNENVQVKIGIYEFLAEDYTTLLDADNDLNIAYIEGPLLFGFVTKEYLQEMMEKYELLEDISSDESESDDEDKEQEEDTDKMQPFVYEEDDTVYLELKETKKDDDDMAKTFKSTTNTTWIEEFYKNNNYSILDNEGGGDCLFATIRDGLKHSNISITVPEIRKMLSESTTQEQFKTYKENYDMFSGEIRELEDKMREARKKHGELAKEYKKIAAKAKQEKDRDNKLILRDKALSIKADFESIKPIFKKYKDEKAVAETNLVEFQFMENIETLDDLKKMINTCKFWADAASITRIEYIMNIKLIVLSSEYYKMGLKERVVTCGDFTLKEIEDKGYFNPKHYIVVEHTGDHYKLIKYKNKGAMLFHELPYKLREDLVERCASSQGKTVYNYIPKFQTYMGVPTTMPTVGDDVEEEITSDNEAEMTPSVSKTNDSEPLFDDSVIFQFYSKSKDAAPGKGSGETISPKMEKEFIELGKIKNWRHKLSNFHTKKDKNKNVVALFKLDGYTWASVEHYYHANKFKKNNMDYYKLFTMESKSEISTDPIAAKGAGGKTGKVNKKKFRPKNVVMDEDFMMNGKNEDVMYNGQLAKYKQNPELKDMLLLTKDAKLVHFSRGGSIVFYDTMKVRKLLRNESK